MTEPILPRYSRFESFRVTPRSEDVLRALRTFTAERGYSPTVRELADAVGLASPSAVAGHLYRLRRDGLVEWQDGRPRTLRVTEKGELTAAGRLYRVEVPSRWVA